MFLVFSIAIPLLEIVAAVISSGVITDYPRLIRSPDVYLAATPDLPLAGAPGVSLNFQAMLVPCGLYWVFPVVCQAASSRMSASVQ